MASDRSARLPRRAVSEPSDRTTRPGGWFRLRSVRAATAAMLVLAWLVPAAASAAEGLDISTPYPAVAVAPGSEVSFDITVSTASPGRVGLALQQVPEGWTATLRGGGFVVDGVQTRGNEPAEVTLDVNVPAEASGTQAIVVRATQGGLTTDLPLSFRIEAEASGGVTLTTEFPNLRGPSDATFPFNLDLNNETPRDLTFVVNAEPPEGWEAVATVSGQERAASALVEAGGNVGIEVEVTPPEGVAAGVVTIPVTATGGGQTASAELQVEITGSYSMTLNTPDQRLNTSGSAGSEIRQTFVITNTGTAPLEGVTMSDPNKPSGWTVAFDPPTIPAIAAGQTGNTFEVTAIITPSGDAIAGDYNVTIEASNDNAEASQQLRVTVETSLLWGAVGIALIVAVLAGLWFVFQRYGRR